MNLLNLNDLLIPGIPVLEKILRPVVVYFFLIIGLRVSGKRELAQLNPFDFVVLLTLSNTVQNAIIGNDNSLSGGIIGAVSLLFVNYIVVKFLFKHKNFERLVEGSSDVLIDAGKIRHENLKKELITLAELKMAAHKQGFASLAEIDKAVIEPDGVISFMHHEPPEEEKRHDEIMTLLKNIQNSLDKSRKSAD